MERGQKQQQQQQQVWQKVVHFVLLQQSSMYRASSVVVLIVVFMECVCVRVCVFFPFILDVKFVGCTSRGHTGERSHRISHPPSFCGACLFFLARRIQSSLFLIDREVEFCVLTI